jgi:stage II sporulation protein D
VERGAFLSGTLALLTGGLDIWSTPAPSGGTIRVLLTADRGGEMPRMIDARSFAFGGNTWRGTPSFLGGPAGREGIITTLALDEYLYGVLPLEMSAGWPSTALQAQAIVARTYAVQRRVPGRAYDVTIAQSDQRYGGVRAETAATSAAVDASRGAILSYAGAGASVFYGSCCGGHTADAAELWGRRPLPYLRGVVDPHCTGAPDYRWRRTVALDACAASLASRVSAPITGFVLGTRDDAGRPRTIDILASNGQTTLTAVEFRALLGGEVVRSAWIREVGIANTLAGAQVVIDGSGRGHGVGLCQWGARFMSAGGASASEILAFYFPGTSVSGISG